MKIEAGIFDLGGVLCENADKFFWRDGFKIRLGLSDDELKRVTTGIRDDVQTGRTSEEDFWTKMSEELGIEIPPDILLSEYIPLFGRKDDSLEIARRLKDQRLGTAILSNTVKSHAQYIKSQGLFEHFDHVILSYEVGLAKPDPRIYELTLERLGVEPAQAFFTDDREENLKPAQDLGIEVVLFESSDQLRSDLGKLGLVV